MPILGVDVSHYQGSPGWAAVKASGRDFCVLKATEGTGYVDPTCNGTPTVPSNRRNAHAAGLIVGLYHFARAGNAVAEAQFFLRTVGTLQPGEFLVLDWEVPGANPPGWCKTWLDTVYAATGVRPLIYMNQSAVNGSNWSAVAADYGLWLAKYDGTTAQPSVAWWGAPAMKQYSDRGSVPGVGSCDVNVFFGGTDQLLKYGKQSGPAPQPAPQEDDVSYLQWSQADKDALKQDLHDYFWTVPAQPPNGIDGHGTPDPTWPADRLRGADVKTGEINDAVKALADKIGQVQTPAIDEAKLAVALLADPKAVDALGAAIAAHLQLAPRDA